jgi:hypothetical protein
VASVTYVFDGHRVELGESADGEHWVCDCRAYRAGVSLLGPRCSHAWDAWLFSFTERLLKSGGVTAPESMQ